jgi:hypothetical protein
MYAFSLTYLKLLDSRHVYMLPTGLRLAETRIAVAVEARRHCMDGYDKVIVPTGTGTHLAGVIEGFRGGLTEVVGVLGYSQNLMRLAKYAKVDPDALMDESYEYKDKVEYPAPFDANPYYETKAWKWIQENRRPREKILLWNIGGRRPAPELGEV